MDILEKMAKIPWIKQETPAAVEDFFHALRLPVPAKNEFTLTTDKGFIVFLNPYGLAIRMTSHDIAPAAHPLVLQPLLRTTAGQYRIDITPGIECPIKYNDAYELAECLYFDHGGNYNGGYLPGTTIPVVIDPESIEILSGSAKKTAELLRRHNYLDKAQNPQDKLYRPLKKLFNEAWPGCKGKPDHEKLQTAWDKCRQMKDEGKLVASWLKGGIFTEGNYKNAFTGSKLYAARLEPSP